METSTVTQKGQVTIPASIRKQLGLRTGDRVAFLNEGGRVLVKPVQQKIDAAFGLIKARRSASLADFERAIKSRAAK